jgi:Na+/melibiose symporter-like transporter
MARAGKVPVAVKFCYGFGAVAEAAIFITTLTFGALYYNQALRLNADLVGWGLFLAIIFDAISDPAVGALSDRWKSKWGRRHPFLFVAPIPLGISLYFFFSPPGWLTAVAAGADQPEQIPLFLWMTGWHILVRLFLTMYIVPHHALGAEMSSDYNERASVFSYNAMIGNAFAYGYVYIAYRMLPEESVRAYDGELVAGQLDAANYPPLVLLACGSAIVGIFVCAFGTRKEIPHLDGPSKSVSRFSPWAVVGDVCETFRNRNYVMLLLGLLFLEITKGTMETLGLFLSTYFWELKPDELKWFGIAAVVGNVSGAWLAPYWIRKFGKRLVCVGSVAMHCALIPLPVLDRLLGWNVATPANDSSMLFPFLLIHVALYTHFLGGLAVAVLSMLADVIDQHNLRTGHVQSAIFYSSRTFFAKVSWSIASLISGIALMYLVGLKSGDVPEDLAPDVISRLGWVYAVGCLGGVLSAFAYAKYRLTKDDHARIREELDSRKAATDGDA